MNARVRRVTFSRRESSVRAMRSDMRGLISSNLITFGMISRSVIVRDDVFIRKKSHPTSTSASKTQ